MAGSPNVPGTIPFAGASLPYREQFFSTTFTAGTSTQNVSPPGNSIKSYGYARALRVYTTASGGNPLTHRTAASRCPARAGTPNANGAAMRKRLLHLFSSDHASSKLTTCVIP